MEQAVSSGRRDFKTALVRFIKFLGVGGVATLIQYGLLILLVEKLAVDTVQASAASYAISAVFNYLMNYYFTFSSAASHKLAAARFAVVVVIGLGINSALMYALTEHLKLHYLIAQVSATVVVLMWNFLAHRFWTYRHD